MMDMVHDVVGAYRELVRVNSYPGDVVSVKQYSQNNTIQVPFYDHTLLFVMMLLDAEVTFCLVGDYEGAARDLISRLTYAKAVALEEADFVFVLLAATPHDVREAIHRAKIGNLVNPHESATLICEVKALNYGESLLVSGPGVETRKELHMAFVEGWLGVRREKNKEFPLGIEMYFVDQSGLIAAMPRTTQVKGCD